MVKIVPTGEKQKLTLGINKEIVQKAKDLRINISAITEQVLQVITFDQKGNTRDDLANAYEALFSAIKSNLKKYGTSVEVGQKIEVDTKSGDMFDFRLILRDGGLYQENSAMEVWQRRSVLEDISFLYSPQQILKNLLNELIKAAENNREKIKEFQIALRVVQALSDQSTEADINKRIPGENMRSNKHGINY